MNKERCITIVVSSPEPEADCDVVAYHESEGWQSYIDCGAWHEYVWQYAENKEQAIRQHDTKWMEWRDHWNSGRPEKDTY